jgi:hypothetical protein
LIKTYVKFILKRLFFMVRIFFCESQNKLWQRGLWWIIELPTTIKVKTIPTFDLLVWNCIFYQKTPFITFPATYSNPLLQPPLLLLLLECVMRLIASLSY